MSWSRFFFCARIKTNKVAPDDFREFIMDSIKMEVPEVLRGITDNPSNTTCVDCGSSDTAWASLGFGTLVCLKCAGFHRSLGTHITSVRAIRLDSWSPEQVKILQLGGNAAFHEHCSTLEMDSEVCLTMAKYGNPKVLYYSAILKAILNSQSTPEYTETDWKDTASYALQVSANFVTNVQETALNGAAPGGSTENSPKKNSPVRPANWVPDNAATHCMECNAAFTFLFRRHHCRRCGRTVCGNCAPANNDRPIPEWGYPNPVRHCRKCYKSPAVDWKS